MEFTNRIKTIVEERIVPKIFDNKLDTALFPYRFIGTGKKFDSYTTTFALKLDKNTMGGAFSGMDTHDNGLVETRQKMIYEPKYRYKPVTLAGTEMSVNKGPGRVLDYARAELDSSMGDFMDDIAVAGYGDGTAFSGKEINGFDNLIDDGTTAVTVGGLSRTTYPSLAGTRTSFSTGLSMARLSTLRSSVSGGSAISEQPSIIVSNEPVRDLFKQILTPMMRYNVEQTTQYISRTSRGVIKGSELTSISGYSAIVYEGIPWVADEKSTAQTLWMANEKYLYWCGLSLDGTQPFKVGSATHEGGAYADMPSNFTGLQFREFMNSYNQLAQTGYIYLAGELVTPQPRRLGRGTSISTL